MHYPPALVQRARDEARWLHDFIAAGGWRFGEAAATLTLDSELARWRALST